MKILHSKLDWYAILRPGMEERSAPHFPTRAEARKWLHTNRELVRILRGYESIPRQETICQKPTTVRGIK